MVSLYIFLFLQKRHASRNAVDRDIAKVIWVRSMYCSAWTPRPNRTVASAQWAKRIRVEAAAAPGRASAAISRVAAMYASKRAVSEHKIKHMNTWYILLLFVSASWRCRRIQDDNVVHQIGVKSRFTFKKLLLWFRIFNLTFFCLQWTRSQGHRMLAKFRKLLHSIDEQSVQRLSNQHSRWLTVQNDDIFECFQADTNFSFGNFLSGVDRLQFEYFVYLWNIQKAHRDKNVPNLYCVCSSCNRNAESTQQLHWISGISNSSFLQLSLLRRKSVCNISGVFIGTANRKRVIIVMNICVKWIMRWSCQSNI